MFFDKLVLQCAVNTTVYNSNLLHGLWNPEVQCLILKGSPIILILIQINPIPSIDNYFSEIHSNIALSSTPTPVGVPVKIVKTLLPFSFWLHCLLIF